jgi:hypothetical protein
MSDGAPRAMKITFTAEAAEAAEAAEIAEQEL